MNPATPHNPEPPEAITGAATSEISQEKPWPDPPTGPALKPPTRDAARRVLWAGRISVSFLTIALLALLGRVAQLQQRPDPRVTDLLALQSSEHPLDARRGMLLDRRGRPLANTRVAYRLFVDPAILADPAGLSATVGYTLDYDPIELEMAMAKRPGSRYVILDPRVPDNKIDEARNLVTSMRGLSLEPYLVRDYPQGPLAGQVVGFVDRDGKGIEGMERVFNDELAGHEGGYHLLRDSRRRPLWIDADYQAPHDGEALRLTLDLNLQQIAEAELEAAVAEFGAKAGQMVVLDPATGDVLAMANFPRVDPATAGNEDPDLRRNRAVTDVFEPGSIFKPLVWAAATELGLADPNEMLDCSEQGWWKPERGPILRDANPHGTISWEEVLVLSSNIGMGIVAERLGKQGLFDIVEDFGFGKTTGSKLPGELPGLLRKADDWSWTDLTRIPMGQGIAVTPLQVTRAFAALANDGVLVTPRIVINDKEYATEKLDPPSRVLSPQTAHQTRQVLRRVITEGTGRKANSQRYELFGKSGTAQLPDPINGGYMEAGYVSSFVAGAPLDHPRLVVGCFIHQPDKSIGHYGGTVAGPAVMRFMEQALDYLGQNPSTPYNAALAAQQ